MKHPESRYVLIIAATLVFVFPPDALSQARKRNLKEYKGGQFYDLQNTITVEEANAQKAPLRHHLWERWKTRTKGFYRATFYTIEGVPSPCTYFVEPDPLGTWRVVVECKARHCPFISKVKCRKYLKTVFVSTFDMVERIEYGYHVSSPSPPKIPDNEERHGLRFVLIFRDSVSGRTGEL